MTYALPNPSILKYLSTAFVQYFHSILLSALLNEFNIHCNTIMIENKKYISILHSSSVLEVALPII